MSYLKSLCCIDCGKEYSPQVSEARCPECGKRGLFSGILDPVYDYRSIARAVSKEDLEKRQPSLWKYVEFMPISDRSKIVTLGEGGTPLIRCENLGMEFGLENLYVKNDAISPTCSFKDRACSLIVSKCNEDGVTDVALMSDGNNGASVAAYCARARITCNVFVPRSSVVAKINQILMYGARVFLVNGLALEAGMLSLQACERYGWTNISQIKIVNPFPSEGHKSCSFEICEQLGWKPPDWHITPSASGDSIGGHWKGYQEYHKLGFISRLPRMVSIQPEGANPLVKAFEQNKTWLEIEPFEPNTICDALVAGNVCGSWALNCLKDSNGHALAVSDQEALDAQKLLAEKEGIFVEHSSAVSLAGLRKLLNQGVVEKNHIVVCVVTGSGLKVPATAAEICGRPIPIEATMDALEEVI